MVQTYWILHIYIIIQFSKLYIFFQITELFYLARMQVDQKWQ